MKFLLPWFLTFSVSAANLVPNSSFECGPGRGWMWSGVSDRAGNLYSPSEQINATNYHGASSAAFQSRLLSRAIYLTAGTYTLSFYGRGSPNETVFYGIMGDAGLGTTPASSGTFTNGWQRFTATQALSTNGFYHVKLYHVNGTQCLADAVQVESGSSATTYAPMYPVECGLDTADQNNFFFAGDTPAFRLRFWNTGGATTAHGEYQVYDLWNTSLASNKFNVSLGAATNTTEVINLPAHYGWMRIVARLYDSNDSWDETSVAVFPYTAATTANTNGFLGTHPNYSAHHLQRERRSGFTFGRDLSPAATVRWTTIEPSRTNFVWQDAIVGAFATNGLVPVCELTTGLDGTWPTWATNGDGTADIGAYTNYCAQVVARYSAAPYNIHYWEIFNEPQNNTSNPNLADAATYASLLSKAAAVVKASDPSSYIIGMGGLNSATNGWAVWTNLSGADQANLSAVSCHLYPQDNSSDPMASESDVHFASVQAWASTFAGLIPVWNTESGTFGVGGYKGLNALLQGNYDTYGTYSPEFSRNEREQRPLASVDRLSYVALRSLGWGFAKYVNYWSKYFNDQMLDLSPTDPTVMEMGDFEKPTGVALLMANYFAGVGLGRITNASATTMDAFCFTNALGSVVAAWNYDRTFKNLTVTNSAFALYNVMGNQLVTNQSTVLITRTPQYLVSGTLSIAALSNTVKNASVATATFTTPPALSFDVAPSGGWQGTSPLTLVKWSGVSQKWLPWTGTTATNLQYKWKLDAGAYSSLSQSNHVWLSSLSQGNHTIYVTAQDGDLNSAEYSYRFDNTTNSTPLRVTNVRVTTLTGH